MPYKRVRSSDAPLNTFETVRHSARKVTVYIIKNRPLFDFEWNQKGFFFVNLLGTSEVPSDYFDFNDPI